MFYNAFNKRLMKQITNNILMIRPVSFRYNETTAVKVKNKDDEIIKKENKDKKITKFEKKGERTNIKFFSYLIVFILSFVALIILLDTFKTPLATVFPQLEIILFNLFETLKDIRLFIIDLS